MEATAWLNQLIGRTHDHALLFSIIPTTFLAILLLLLALWLFRVRSIDDLPLPPGPWSLPWLGYLPFIDTEAPYETFQQLARQYGPVYSVRLGDVFTVVVSDPKLIRQAFAQEAFAGRAPLYLTHGIMKGHGLICAEGDMWREHRKFMVGVMKELGMGRSGDGRALMEARIMDRVMELVQSLRASEGESVDMVPKLRHCIGNITNGVVFGRHYAEDDPIWIWLQHLLDEGMKQVAVAGPLNFLPILRFLPKFRQTMSFILDGQRETHRHYQEIIDAHQFDGDGVYSDVIEAYLLEMERRGEDPGTFTMTQLHHVLADLFGAGTDTAMTTIKWVLLYMIRHPDVQSQVQEEIDSVIGRQRLPSTSDMVRLPMTEAAIMEVQRIKNILPLGVPHGTVQDCALAGYRIPKKTMVVPLLCAINTDPVLWEDPLTFRPERFLDRSTDPVSVCKPDFFMPFQTGRRMCIGDELGRTIVFLFAATVLQQFRLSFPQGFHYDWDRKPEYGFTLVPRPYRIAVQTRR
uniref:CYP306A1 n=1 Tax=Diaphanosoma celebensis TaxID=2184134 RepID=A0A896SZF5_9CRUS|nr:CYP306A1 [Diaphanosoma celebensis]QST15037.1 CYP306A1 protein [Diaphanosoma celebensis]